MPATRSSTASPRKRVSPEEAASPRRITRQRPTGAQGASIAPQLPNAHPISSSGLGSPAQSQVLLPTLQQAVGTHLASNINTPEDEAPSKDTSTEPPQSYVRVGESADGYRGGKLDRRTPPAHETHFDMTSRPTLTSDFGLGSMKSSLSVYLPTSSAVETRLLNINKPPNWTGGIEGETFRVRPRE
ncbi:hypothetical protein B0H11DRAFT_1922825 [Mycena galericulata]|nr:hypothetical protein B0H11DRAFT_1922825 [Mycena galericulata]